MTELRPMPNLDDLKVALPPYLSAALDDMARRWRDAVDYDFASLARARGVVGGLLVAVAWKDQHTLKWVMALNDHITSRRADLLAKRSAVSRQDEVDRQVAEIKASLDEKFWTLLEVIIDQYRPLCDPEQWQATKDRIYATLEEGATKPGL